MDGWMDRVDPGMAAAWPPQLEKRQIDHSLRTIHRRAAPVTIKFNDNIIIGSAILCILPEKDKREFRSPSVWIVPTQRPSAESFK